MTASGPFCCANFLGVGRTSSLKPTQTDQTLGHGHGFGPFAWVSPPREGLGGCRRLETVRSLFGLEQSQARLLPEQLDSCHLLAVGSQLAKLG